MFFLSLCVVLKNKKPPLRQNCSAIRTDKLRGATLIHGCAVLSPGTLYPDD